MTAHQIAEKLTADILRSILDYDPETGKFDWRNNRRKAGCLDNFGYHRIQVLGKLYKAHRLAWLHYYGEWPEQDVDHVNGVRSDNRIANLRSATKGQQSQNVASPYRKSGLPRGVSWCAKSKGYRAQSGAKTRRTISASTPHLTPLQRSTARRPCDCMANSQCFADPLLKGQTND